MPTVVLLGTLDTKGREYAFLRDRLLEQDVDVLVVDAGVNDPVGLEPDVPNTELASNVAALAAAGDRGAAVAAILGEEAKAARALALRSLVLLILAVSCATASTSAERSSDRCPALPHSPAAFSICPASVQ